MFVNEFDPFAAAWCRELMAAGNLPAGTVDERSITDVAADDVRGHRECHWFGGIGGWPLALRIAGWPAERPVWTGSCPCQPYSSAGKRKGNADERDLWPVFARLIRECRPQCVFGEQVSAAIRHGWLDRVHDDLEPEGYTVGAVVLTAAGVGAPHLRQRLYWVAHTAMRGRQQQPDAGPASVLNRSPEEKEQVQQSCTDGASVCGVAHTGHAGPRSGEARTGRLETQERTQPEQHFAVRGVVARGMGDPGGDELGRLAGSSLGAQAEGAGVGQVDGACGVVPRPASGAGGVGDAASAGHGATGSEEQPPAFGLVSQLSGNRAVWDHWRNAVGIDCRDGKRRRVPAQPGVQCVADGLPAGVGRGGVPCAARYPLAGKSPNRVARLRGYGNAICVQTAALFVRAFLESEGDGE